MTSDRLSLRAQSLFLLGGVLFGYVAKMNPSVEAHSNYLIVIVFLIMAAIAIRVSRLPSSGKKAKWLNYGIACAGFGVALLSFPT